MPNSETAGHAHDPVLVRRLESVERENARVRRISTMTMALLAITLGLAAAVIYMASRRGMPGLVADVLESRSFVVRDKSGAIRGAWGMADDGTLRLTLQGAADQRSITLNLLADGSAGMSFSDSAGNPRVVLALLPDATGSLAFADAAGGTRTAYGINPNGSVTLVFADRNGRTRAGIGVDPRGGSMLTVDDAGVAPVESEGDTASD
jgi:hypothetical protein